MTLKAILKCSFVGAIPILSLKLDLKPRSPGVAVPPPEPTSFLPPVGVASVAPNVCLAQDEKAYYEAVAGSAIVDVYVNYHRVTAHHKALLSGLQTVFPRAFVPFGGTLLAGLRYGSLVGFTGRRFNYVDGDADYVLFCRKGEGQAKIEKLVEVLNASDVGDGAQPNWTSRHRYKGGKAIYVVEAQRYPLSTTTWQNLQDAATQETALKKDVYGMADPQWQRTDSIKFYGDLVVIEEGENQTFELRDPKQNGTGLGPFINEDQTSEPKTLQNLEHLTPPAFAKPGVPVTWGRVLMEGFEIEIPATLTQFVTKWYNPASTTPHSAYVYPPPQNDEQKMNLSSGDWFRYKTFRLQPSEKRIIYAHLQKLHEQGYLSLFPFFSEEQKREIQAKVPDDDLSTYAMAYAKEPQS